MKKKILIDLDVVTIALWGKPDEREKTAKKFIQRVEKNEFEVIIPFLLIELVLQWKHKILKEKIKEFYIQNSIVLSDTQINKNFEKISHVELIIHKLFSHNIKEEDIILAMITSIFCLDYLVTFNRKHLKNKEAIINQILSKYNLRTIKIVLPNEI